MLARSQAPQAPPASPAWVCPQGYPVQSQWEGGSTGDWPPSSQTFPESHKTNSILPSRAPPS